jgi:hypothetical protein
LIMKIESWNNQQNHETVVCHVLMMCVCEI